MQQGSAGVVVELDESPQHVAQLVGPKLVLRVGECVCMCVCVCVNVCVYVFV